MLKSASDVSIYMHLHATDNFSRRNFQMHFSCRVKGNTLLHIFLFRMNHFHYLMYKLHYTTLSIHCNTILTCIASHFSISATLQLELFFKIGHVCKILKGFQTGQDLTQFAVKILCDDYTGCDKVDSYFATEADTMVDILYMSMTCMWISLKYLHLTGQFTNLSC